MSYYWTGLKSCIVALLFEKFLSDKLYFLISLSCPCCAIDCNLFFCYNFRREAQCPVDAERGSRRCQQCFSYSKSRRKFQTVISIRLLGRAQYAAVMGCAYYSFSTLRDIFSNIPVPSSRYGKVFLFLKRSFISFRIAIPTLYRRLQSFQLCRVAACISITFVSNLVFLFWNLEVCLGKLLFGQRANHSVSAQLRLSYGEIRRQCVRR